MGDVWIRVVTPELTMLAATLVLAFLHIFLPAAGRTMVNGLGWNAGPRDGVPVRPGIVTERLERAQANLWETLPLFIEDAYKQYHTEQAFGAATLLGGVALLSLLLKMVVENLMENERKALRTGGGLEES